ncbi:hypothetical protein OPAG_05628 [Rhodococcus opacus PD630]|nr:hypothetical protein OPAG_05628 [Rhodococcus opacus PD630]PBC50485.1 hypothetical protein CJ177_38520 [Rhodococcus sp. ACPA1]RKM75783.1 hypothetical protein COO55_29625 [Rhodococcus opacus]RZK58844.1 MAG: hypothetical protein EOP27_01045 [Rhodococcus sp. (in: high G+C Gram-positive bacteria)]
MISCRPGSGDTPLRRGCREPGAGSARLAFPEDRCANHRQPVDLARDLRVRSHNGLSFSVGARTAWDRFDGCT